MSCSPVDVVMGRLFPLTPRVLMALMVVPSARMPAQDGTATPSKGGREGIVGTGVSRCPEAHSRWASFLYYSFVDKVIIYININRDLRDNFIAFSSRQTARWPPPPR